MVIFGGLEFIALKWIGGKMTAALVTHLAHAPATAVAHFAHAATTNVIASAASAGSAGGAAGTLYHGARGCYKLAKKVNRVQERERIGALFGNPAMTDEQRAELLAVVILMHFMEGYYVSLERTAAAGGGAAKKTALDEMEPCGRCDCRDYDQATGRQCSCGHMAYLHDKITETQLEDSESFEWLQHGMAVDVYPHLQNYDGGGNLKTVLGQIDTCMEYGCPCWDFDRDEGRELFSRRCRCGHRFREHQVTGQWHWIIELLIAKAIEEMVEQDSSSSDSDDDDEDSDNDVDDDDDGDNDVDSDNDNDMYYDDDDSDF